MIILHRLAALCLRLRRKRPPLEDLVSAWAGARWDPAIYGQQDPPAGAERESA